MTFFPRKRNSIVIAQARAGQLIKGPNRDYWIEIIVLDGKMLARRSWLVLFDPQQRPTLLSLCDRGDRENDDTICSECALQKMEWLANACASVCAFLTSAVRPLIPAIGTVRDSITHFAHMDAHVRVQAPLFIDRTLVHPVV